MSKDVVRSISKGQAVAFADVENVATELNVVVPTLDASVPVPSNFRSMWVDADDQLSATVTSDDHYGYFPIVQAFNPGDAITSRFAHWLGDPLRQKVFTASSLTLFTVLGAVVGAGLAVTAGVHAVSFGVFVLAGAVFGVAMGGISVAIFGSLKQRVVDLFFNALDSQYEEKILLWAKEHYGLSIPPGVWGQLSDQVSKNITYLGMKDGESVYCFETESGWAIGYRDGTELPVLANKKELAEA